MVTFISDPEPDASEPEPDAPSIPEEPEPEDPEASIAVISGSAAPDAPAALPSSLASIFDCGEEEPSFPLSLYSWVDLSTVMTLRTHPRSVPEGYACCGWISTEANKVGEKVGHGRRRRDEGGKTSPGSLIVALHVCPLACSFPGVLGTFP